MMKLINYYKNETFTYWFYSVMPFIVLLEAYMYWQQSIKTPMIPLLSFIIQFCGVTGLGLVLFQINTYIQFITSLKRLAPEIKEGIREEAVNGVKRGRFLLTEDVLIYYGMFSKKVIKRDEISRIKRNKGTLEKYVPRAGRIKIEYDTTLVYLKNGMEMQIDCSMDSMDGGKGELPYNSVIGVVLLGIFFGYMTIYPRMLDYYAGETQIERFLFHASYDVYFWLASVITVAVIGIIAYVLRYIFLPAKMNKNNIKIAGILLVVVVMLVVGFYLEGKEEAALAREDLNAYYAGEFVEVKRVNEQRERYYYEAGRLFYEHADRLSLEPVIWTSQGGNLLFLQSAFDESPEIESIYQVEYLENTKLVVSFKQR